MLHVQNCMLQEGILGHIYLFSWFYVFLNFSSKIIELSGLELQKLRVNLQKMQLQNMQLAQSNSQIVAVCLLATLSMFHLLSGFCFSVIFC